MVLGEETLTGEAASESPSGTAHRYRLLHELGRGGSGSVWLAHDREQQCSVALKIPAIELVQNPTAFAAFASEYARAAALRHPNILRVFGLARASQAVPPGSVWMIMEYAAGGDLSQLRGGSGRSTRSRIREVLRTAIAVANAVDFAHGCGVIHRDLKLSNILLMADGTPKVADFGNALLQSQLPSAIAGRGSPYSMSPQQLAGAAAEASDDIYAFGALLYEVLSGYPPFYPDISAARVATECAPELGPEVAPPALAALVSRCLHKQPKLRPATMRMVEQQLIAILSQLAAPSILSEEPQPKPAIAPPTLRPPAGHGEPLRGEWQRPGASGIDAAELRRQGFRRGLFAAALVLGVLAVVGVFVALPKWVAAPAPVAAPRVESPPTPAVPVKELDFAALAQAKQQAEELRAPLAERMAKLQARAVAQWGSQDLQQATEALAAADKHVTAREYTQAVELFTALDPMLQRLEQQAEEVLKTQLQAGAAALADGRSSDATAAFTLAQQIEAGNKTASTGLKRAATLDEVLKTLADADRAEKDADLAAAAAGYRKALVLDAQTTRASEGLARVQSHMAGNSFASSMAQGFGALTKADYAGARSAFESAGKIRPGAVEVTQALKQVEQEERTRTIGSRLDAGRQFETQEKWVEALKEYQAVVQLDSTVAAANDGIARTRPRVDLHQQLEVYLTQPERLFSAPVRSAAQGTLQRARQIQPAGPVLERQMTQLADWLARAEVPVQVSLQSDNVTSVAIRRVGELGIFTEKSLSLAPGTYIVVGTRPGYRDVRREMTVVPGKPPEPLTIRCEEKI